jgi:hypothetical protein
MRIKGGAGMLLKLKAKIIERYRTQSRFAVVCGKGEQWISRILMGRQAPTEEDKALISRKLGIENIDEYFSATDREEKDEATATS